MVISGDLGGVRGDWLRPREGSRGGWEAEAAGGVGSRGLCIGDEAVRVDSEEGGGLWSTPASGWLQGEWERRPLESCSLERSCLAESLRGLEARGDRDRCLDFLLPVRWRLEERDFREGERLSLRERPL